MSDITGEERKLIYKLRQKVGDVLTKERLKDDWFLIRWLRARDLNLVKAEAMLRSSMEWRKEHEVDKTLSNTLDPFFPLNYPFDVSLKDKGGRPLLFLPLGKWDARRALDDGKMEALISYVNFFFESIAKNIKESGEVTKGQPHSQFTAIVDWDGYSFRQLTNIKAAKTVLTMCSVYESHYPEILSQAIFFNSTPVFQILWSLMRKVFDEKTVGKIRVFGTNKKDWESELEKILDMKELTNLKLWSGERIPIQEEDEDLKVQNVLINDKEISTLIKN